ncbi:MAG: hypothetical protein V2A63_00640 [Patescibacteria group bacterium]
MQKKFFEKIGSAAHNFSIVEFMLGALLARLISEDNKIGAIAVAQMSFKNLLDALSCIMRYKFPEREEVDSLIVKLSQAEEKRNQIFHSVHLYRHPEMEGEIERIKIVAKRKRGLLYKKEEKAESDIDSFSKNLINLIDEIEKLQQSIFNGEDFRI